MMTKRFISTLAVCLVPFALSGCLPWETKDKVLEIVLTGETSRDFSQNETTFYWTNVAEIKIAKEIRNILKDNGYNEGDIKSAHVTSMSYGVTSFSQEHDWDISGSITVSYDGNAETILNYTSQSVKAALGQKISASLLAPGVDLINSALDDFLAGGNPILTFTINNGSTSPAPSVEDPMIFDWRAWLAIQIILDESVEVPDPF